MFEVKGCEETIDIKDISNKSGSKSQIVYIPEFQLRKWSLESWKNRKKIRSDLTRMQFLSRFKV